MDCKLEDLDVAQGLTAEIVCAWLRRNGWEYGPAKPQGDYLPPGKFWSKNGVSIWEASVITHFGDIARVEQRNAEVLLREINPRLRDGWPSEEDLACYKHWVVHVVAVDALAFFTSDTMRNRKAHAPDAPVRCWPCDAAGNKVHWS